MKKLLDHINSGVKYDLIIWDFTSNHFLLPLLKKLNYPPTIATSAFGVTHFYTSIFGNEVNLASSPLWMMLYTDKMTFSERVMNYIIATYYYIIKDYWYYPSQTKISEKVFGEKVPSLFELQKHISLLLLNTDIIFDYPQSLPPAIINVGGLHLKRVEELPKVH